MTPERFAEIELYTKHLTASGQLVGGCLRECLEEIARLRADASTASPSCDRCQSAHCCSVTGSTVPPLCVTDPDGSLPLWMPWTNTDVQARVDPLHAEINKLREEKSLIAGAMRADDAQLMVAMARVSKTPEDHLGFGCDAPEWMADEILRLRAEAGRVVVPELEGIPVVQPEFDDSGNKTHWNVFDSDTDRLLWTEDPEEEWRKHRRIAAHSVPSSRVLKDGEVAVDAEEWAAMCDLGFDPVPCCLDHHGFCQEHNWFSEKPCPTAILQRLYALRTQATATESGKAREVEG